MFRNAMRSFKDLVLIIICAAVVVGMLALAGYRVADVYYKAAWIVMHFPPDGEICSEPFCLRTDNTTNDLHGEKRFLQIHFDYCPDHLPSGFQARGGRTVPICVIFGFLIAFLSFASVPIMGALFRIAAWPILIPLRLAGRLPKGHLLPFARFADSSEPARGDWLEPAGMLTGAIAAVAALAMYCWW